MDLRDEFAVHAMNGFIAGHCSQPTSAPIGELSHSHMAQVAYQVADCMMVARKTSDAEEAANSVSDTSAMDAMYRLVDVDQSAESPEEYVRKAAPVIQGWSDTRHQ